MNKQLLTERLDKLLPHWAEHTAEHVAEVAHWRAEAAGVVSEQVLNRMAEAEARMVAAREALVAAHEALDSHGAAPGKHRHV